MLNKKGDEIQYKIVECNKKSKFRKPKRVPVNYESIDKWKMPEISADLIKGPFLEESSFATLFPKYREKYIREVFSFIQKGLKESGIKAELDLVEGSMTVRTTKKTFDPYAIIKARDIIKLLSRSVPYQVCLRLLNDNIYCDIIKIRSLVVNKEKFLKRRKRLIGPNGDTIKALEILTECYIMVQGHTVSVIGHYRKLKQVRRIINDVMHNIHPVYFIKELMIKNELAKDEKLKNENWDRFLPQFKKLKQAKIKRKKLIKKKKERKTFPNQPKPRIIDLQMESGEYFLNEKEKDEQKKEKLLDRKKLKKKQRNQQRISQYQEPNKKDEIKRRIAKKKKIKKKNENIDDIVKRFKVDVKSDLI